MNSICRGIQVVRETPSNAIANIFRPSFDFVPNSVNRVGASRFHDDRICCFLEISFLSLSRFTVPGSRTTGCDCPDVFDRGATLRAEIHFIVLKDHREGVGVPVLPCYGSMWINTSRGPLSNIVGHSRYVSNIGTRSDAGTLNVMVVLDPQHSGFRNCSDAAK